MRRFVALAIGLIAASSPAFAHVHRKLVNQSDPWAITYPYNFERYLLRHLPLIVTAQTINPGGGGGGGGAITAPLGVNTIAASVSTTPATSSIWNNASVGATAAGVPADATYIGMYVAGNLVGIPGNNYGVYTDESTGSQFHADLISAPNLDITGPAVAGWTGVTPGGTAASTIYAGDINLASIGASAVTHDPCFNNFANTFNAQINLTASGVIITHTTGKVPYICSIDIVSSAAENIALVEGTGSVCATNIFGLAGGATAATGWNITGNGLAEGNGQAVRYSGIGNTANPGDSHASGADVCLIVSGSAQVSGSARVVQQ